MERVMLYPLIDQQLVDYWNYYKIPNSKHDIPFTTTSGTINSNIKLIYSQENRDSIPMNYFILPNHPNPSNISSNSNISQRLYIGFTIDSTSDTVHRLNYNQKSYKIMKSGIDISTGGHNYAATAYWPTIQYNDNENGNDNIPILKRVIKEYL